MLSVVTNFPCGGLSEAVSAIFFCKLSLTKKIKRTLYKTFFICLTEFTLVSFQLRCRLYIARGARHKPKISVELILSRSPVKDLTVLSRWRYSWRILDDNEAQKMKKTAIAIAVALAGFATVAQAARKITPGTLVLNWAGPSTMTLVLFLTMVRPTKTNWVQVLLVVTRLTRMLALKWVTTG